MSRNLNFFSQDLRPGLSFCSVAFISLTVWPLFISFLLTSPAKAIDKIYSPNMVLGELELEYNGNTSFDKHYGKNDLQAHQLEIEYGLIDRLNLGLSSTFERNPEQGIQFTNFEFETRYQFFEQGDAWIDSGFLASYHIGVVSQTPDAIELKLLLEKTTGNFLHRLNIGIAQEIGHFATGGPDRVILWSSRYRLNRYFQPGFEIQSDLGKANGGLTFNRETHYVGPAAYGVIIPHLNYEIAFYTGVSQSASQQAIRLLIEYESYF